MKTIAMFAALFGGSTLVVFAQAADPAIAVPYAKESALAVTLAALIWAFQHLLRAELPEQRKQLTEVLDKIMARDEQHHSDHLVKADQLRDSIAKLGDNCRDFQSETKT